ncbi:hypothetical protein CCACVL1_18666 [Corchorus capsularis]|uniref:Uncharacterized protein n=1 Tax=Corchorus capsularis TaxID=210143 RepID=A0A1R3HKD1_COCAP|nr:hypothetical protein CCACVL1_18666 [Corchorus capsularis]
MAEKQNEQLAVMVFGIQQGNLKRNHQVSSLKTSCSR